MGVPVLATDLYLNVRTPHALKDVTGAAVQASAPQVREDNVRFSQLFKKRQPTAGI